MARRPPRTEAPPATLHADTVSTAERIAQHVIARIQQGALKAGDRVREQDLADHFRVSRGPVREALRILSSSYWVVHEKGKGARVIGTATEIDADSLMIVAALDGLAARFAALRATPEEQALIEQMARRVADAAQQEIDAQAFLQQTWALGNYLVEVSRNPRLREYIGAFSQSGLARLAPLGVSTAQARREAARLWIDVAVAIRNRDAQLAEQCMRSVVERSVREVMRRSIHSDIWNDAPAAENNAGQPRRDA